MANTITIIRMVLSLFLIAFNPKYTVFIIIYSLCGISDLLDGFVARKTKTVSAMGSRLDTIADLLFGFVIIKLLFNFIMTNKIIIIMIFIVAIIRLISVIVIFKKYEKIAILHTYLNKLTGFLMFIYGYFTETKCFAYVICFVALLSAIEELYINIKSKKLDVNKKCIFID